MGSASSSALKRPRSPMRSWYCSQARLAQRLDDQGQHRRVVALAVGGGEGLDAGLAELARVRAVGAAGLIAEGRAVVAVARRHGAAGVARQVQAAGRHGQVGAQAQLLAVGIGEDVGARAQGLADHVEEQVGRLDDAGRHLLVAGAREGAQQALRLGFQGLERRAVSASMAVRRRHARSVRLGAPAAATAMAQSLPREDLAHAATGRLRARRPAPGGLRAIPWCP